MVDGTHTRIGFASVTGLLVTGHQLRMDLTSSTARRRKMFEGLVI